MPTNYVRMIRAEGETPDGVMTFVASTSGEKRDGLDIDQSKWMLDNYRANPVVLLNHDYSSLPLGTASVDVEDGRLMARVTWDTEDENAKTVRGKYERGMMSAVSVGWRDTDDGHELLDVSAVSVPGDPNALLERTRAWALETLKETGGMYITIAERSIGDVEYVTDDGVRLQEIGDNGNDDSADEPVPVADDDSEPTRESWREIAAGMVGVYDVADNADDGQRKAAHKALLPLYRKRGRVAPEFLDAADVAAMDSQEWRGLFLEDELTVTGFRAGKVLSSRNEGKLRAAAQSIMEVLRAAGMDETKEDDTRSIEPGTGPTVDYWSMVRDTLGMEIDDE